MGNWKMKIAKDNFHEIRQRRKCAVNSSESGFTLVELLVVMVILVMLAGLIGPRVVGYLGSSRTKAAAIEVKNLTTSLELYFLDVGDYPSTTEGLASLVDTRVQKKGWNGPYLSKPQLPVDPWGNPYKYEFPGKKGKFDLYTFGRDGKPGGTGEDADTWN
jgi:general secretion pathway protein G